MSFIARELGLNQVSASHSPRDVLLLYFSRLTLGTFLMQAFYSFGAMAPVLVLLLRELDFADRLVGLFLTLTLIGDVLLSLVVTWVADHVGRRRILAIGSLLMVFSGIVFSTSGSFVMLLIGAVLGIVSPSGNEVGPFSAVEIGMLSQLCEPQNRVFLMQWYQVLGFVGISLGNLSTGAIVNSMTARGHTVLDAYRAIFYVYIAAAVVKVVLSFAMTRHVELDHPPVPAPTTTNGEREPLINGNRGEQRQSVTDALLDPPAEGVAAKPQLPLTRLVLLCALFSLDSFASSLIPLSFVSYYFRLRFNAPIGVISKTFASSAIVAGVSQLAAGSLARRIGIIATMVATHMPAQFLTISMALVPTLPAATTAWIIRSIIASMDSGVRGAFLSAVIPKESRTRFLGIINVCKTLSSAPGPTVSGSLASLGGLRFSFLITGSIKLLYDLGLLVAFKTASLDH